MIKLIISLILIGNILSCSGGGGSSGSSSGPALPAVNTITINAPTTAKQDVYYSIDLSAINPAVTAVTKTSGPSWLVYNSITKKLEGSQNAASIDTLALSIVTADGKTSSSNSTIITTLGDPLKQYQWHLNNTGQNAFAVNSGIASFDISQSQAISSGYTGNGIKIAVSDSGVEIAHEDLSTNISSSTSKNYNLSSPYYGDPTPTTGEAHGTAVSGIIGAVGWNNKGGRGVAPKSVISGLWYLDAIQNLATSVDQASGNYDIFNYSYGGGFYVPGSAIDFTVVDSIYNGVLNGRSGKGSIYVKSSGNSHTDTKGPFTLIEAQNLCTYGGTTDGTNYYCGYTGNSNNNGLIENYPYVIQVGAVNANGAKSSYSNPGSSLWIAAPGGEYGDDYPAILTTDLQGCDKGMSSTLNSPYKNSFENNTTLNTNCKYTSVMNGTSSAAPIVSGSIALLLEVKPSLTWRDIKYILASTDLPPSTRELCNSIC